MADILLDGLPVLDLLEITSSTSAVARITQRNQSSVSRIYRQASRQLGLEFRKGTDGVYCSGSNPSLLESLRHSSQKLRLHRNPAEPRWLACGSLAAMPQLPHPALPQTLVGQCDNLHQLLRNRVLDLAVIQRAPGEAPAAAGSPLLERPLIRSRSGDDLLVLRADLEGHPVIGHLITTISSAYRQHQQRHPGLEWLG